MIKIEQCRRCFKQMAMTDLIAHKGRSYRLYVCPGCGHRKVLIIKFTAISK